MRKKIFRLVQVIIFCSLILTCGGKKPVPQNPLLLWYDKPASEWEEALPVGNGRIGAMVFGGTAEERVQFNEETLWTGGPHEYQHNGAYKHLPKIRQLLFSGKQKQAEELAMREFMSVPLRQKKYQPFGDLYVNFPGHESAVEYRRALDLDTGLATVKYKVNKTTFTREIFASFPDQVIVVHLSADKKNSLTFSVRLDSPHEKKNIQILNRNTIILDVGVKDGVLKGQSRIIVSNKGGSTASKNGTIEVTNADNVTLLLTANTTFKNYRDVSADPAEKCSFNLQAAAGKKYKTLKMAHITDFQTLFRRVSLDFGVTEAIHQPTDVRIKNFTTQNDPQLVELYFQYGRYLLITSSRPGTQPANLQGIWNDKLTPPWDSKWTTNINTEMNYWPAEVTNLPECHEALFDMIDDLVESGRKTAQQHYNCRGWVFHHNTDLWRGTAPINHSNHGIWVTGGAWLCTHLWEHYLFTLDKEFLRTRAWPVMKEAALFFVDFLIEDPQTGWLISTPSNSPENGGLVAGPAMDHQIIRSLFGAVIKASQILDMDKQFADSLKTLNQKLAPNQIGQYGQLQEWLQDLDDPDNKHRHVSHLWGVYPGNDINDDLPEFMQAAEKSLIMRGDEGTGWSLAWKINLWARFKDGDHAYKMIQRQLTPAKTAAARKQRGGSYPNLFDAHPPFQIDGNFGGTAGVAEMLLQSNNNIIHLLPALPSSLANGSVTGLRARGGFDITMRWENGGLVSASIVSRMGGLCRVRYGNKQAEFETTAGEKINLNAGLTKK